MKKGEGSCPYSTEINAWEGRWYCEADDEEIGEGTFNCYCYHSIDHHDCPAWKRENGYD